MGSNFLLKRTIADVPIMKKKRDNSPKTFHALAALPKTGTKNFKNLRFNVQSVWLLFLPSEVSVEQWLTPKRAELFPASNSGRIIAGWLRCSWIGVTSSTHPASTQALRGLLVSQEFVGGEVSSCTTHRNSIWIPYEKASRSYPIPLTRQPNRKGIHITKHLLTYWSKFGVFQFISMLLQ